MVINFTVNSSVTHCLWLDVHRGFLPVLCKNINWRPAVSSLFAVFLSETTCFKLNKYVLNLHTQYQVLYLDVSKKQWVCVFFFLFFFPSFVEVWWTNKNYIYLSCTMWCFVIFPPFLSFLFLLLHSWFLTHPYYLPSLNFKSLLFF